MCSDSSSLTDDALNAAIGIGLWVFVSTLLWLIGMALTLRWLWRLVK